MAPDRGLAVDSLTVVRSGRTVVDGASLTLRSGEIVAIIGPNGAGKTSLLEAIVGFLRARSGTVTFDRRPLRSLSAASRVFSYMRDDGEPAAELRVVDTVRQGARLGGAAADLREALIDQLGIRRLLRARGGALSRGEKRRVALCGALATARPIVVLDEPLGVFDPLQVLEVCGVLRARAAAGAGVLLTAHQMSDAEKVATRILLLDGGRTVAAGSLAELRESVGDPSATLEHVFLTLLQRARRDAVA